MASATSSPDGSASQNSPVEQQAIVAYAEARGKDPSSVSLNEVGDSPEGLLHWACVGKEFGARGPNYQQFRRAIKHDDFSRNVYPDLDEPLKLQFRQRWHLRNNFQFTAEKKIITHTFEKKDEDAGEMMTKYQIGTALGLAAFPNECEERTEILGMMNTYYDMAIKTGGRFVTGNDWLKTTQVLFVRRLLTSSCTKAWQEVAQRSSEVNLWEQHALESKARRAYASSMGLTIDQVTLAMVEQTDEGVQGWSEIVSTAARGQAGGMAPKRAKAKPKAKAKAAASDGSNAQALEKTAKGLLALDMQVRSDLGTFKEQMAPIEEATKGSTAWMIPYMNKCNEALEVINVFRSGSEFLQKFERCVLSTEALKKFKKESGAEYHANLVRLQDSMKEPLTLLGVQLAKMQNMAIAAHPEQFETKEPKGKRRKA